MLKCGFPVFNEDAIQVYSSLLKNVYDGNRNKLSQNLTEFQWQSNSATSP